MSKVITFQAPSGTEIDLTRSQIRRMERAGVWPRNSRGEEFCTVSHGLHAGAASLTDDAVTAFIEHSK